MFGHFYNESIRKLVIAFGTLFNDVHIVKYNSNGSEKEKIRVPISYGPKEKFIRRINNMSSISEDVNKTQITLPHIGFDITAIIYDVERATNKLRQTSKSISDTKKSMYNEVPYNIQFGLYVFSRYVEENLQIVEQILPYFNPNFNVTLNLNSIHSKVDVPINLNAVQVMEDYVGDFQTRRSVQSVFSFTAKSYVYGPITTSKPIEGVTIDVINGFKYSSIGATQTARIEITGDYATGSSGGVVYDVTGTA